MITISFAENKLNAVGYRGITAKLDSVSAVSPQNRNPLPRYYHNVSPHFRGTTAVTAVPITVQLSTKDWPSACKK